MEIVDALNIVGGDALLVHQVAVVGDVLVDVPDLLDQLFRLKLFHVLAGHGLNFFLEVVLFHVVSSFL